MAKRPFRGPGALVLGTVQFGVDYGISNTTGKVGLDAAQAILAAADLAGIDRVDTAAAYGDSETVLADLLVDFPAIRVVTKAPRLADGGVEAVLARARLSAERFDGRLDALLLHSATDLAGAEGDRLWTGLTALKEEGLIPRLGFSAYADDAPLMLVQRYSPDVVQIAANVFDQRLTADGTVAAMSDAGAEVHVRSVFLQGLVFLDPEALPSKLASAGPTLLAFHKAVAEVGSSPVSACLDHILNVDGAARLVIGVTRPDELTANLECLVEPSPGLDYSPFAIDDRMILDPWRW